MNLVITEATKEDIPELVRMRIAYILDDFGSISEEERKGMELQLPAYFERNLGNQCVAFIAKDNERLVSVALLIIYEKPANQFFLHGLTGEVLSVYTEPEYRKQGLCSKLIKNLLEYAKTHGLDRVDLNASKEGYPVYKKQGFIDATSTHTPMRYVIG